MSLESRPNNFDPRNQNDPFVDYSAQQLYKFLSGYTLTRDPGMQHEYSNVGAGLLGFAVRGVPGKVSEHSCGNESPIRRTWKARQLRSRRK
jgi:D-alanyl-D-alanine-carboxypeptidase/D-alanyl-D-alanine-endopeptidase